MAARDLTATQRAEAERAEVIAALKAHREIDATIARAVALNIPVTDIAAFAGVTRQTVYNAAERATKATAGALVDMPEDFLPPDPRLAGQVGWRCRHCGKGRIFLGTVHQEAAEARAHQAQCPLNPARTATPTEEMP